MSILLQMRWIESSFAGAARRAGREERGDVEIAVT
jgi:hypothetical protein